MPSLGFTNSWVWKVLCSACSPYVALLCSVLGNSCRSFGRDPDPQASLHEIYIPSVSFHLSPSWVRSSVPGGGQDERPLVSDGGAHRKRGRGEGACHHPLPSRFPVNLKTDVTSHHIVVNCCVATTYTWHTWCLVCKWRSLIQQNRCLLTEFSASAEVEGWNPKESGIFSFWSFDLNKSSDKERRVVPWLVSRRR